MTMRIFSYGGGVQSTAVLVLTAQGKLQYDEFLFADVGADSENPGTLKYYDEIAVPFAAEHGIKLTRVENKISVYSECMRNNRRIIIPIYLSGGRPGDRACTVDKKIRRIASYIRKTYKLKEHLVGLGISTDEIHRAKIGVSKVLGSVTQTNEYPLIDLRLSRHDCQRIIAEVGLPIPPKSSCWFCPFHRPGYWKEMRQNDPEHFMKAVEMEKFINIKRNVLGRDIVFLHPALRPLEQAVDMQGNFFNELENCESGFCMT